MKDDLLNISVSIADRPYRLKVQKEEEENVRNSAKLLNNKINEYQNSYHANDKQDYLAMAALLFTSELRMLQEQKETGESFSNLVFDAVEASLDEIEQLLNATD